MKRTKKVKLADVLWEAANVHMWDGCNSGPEAYTCYAAAVACGRDPHYEGWAFTTRLPILKFFRSLGCKTGSLELFEEFEPGPARQGVRYMWLLLAMHVAEDEGIEIEVAA